MAGFLGKPQAQVHRGGGSSRNPSCHSAAHAQSHLQTRLLLTILRRALWSRRSSCPAEAGWVGLMGARESSWQDHRTGVLLNDTRRTTQRVGKRGLSDKFGSTCLLLCHALTAPIFFFQSLMQQPMFRRAGRRRRAPIAVPRRVEWGRWGRWGGWGGWVLEHVPHSIRSWACKCLAGLHNPLNLSPSLSRIEAEAGKSRPESLEREMLGRGDCGNSDLPQSHFFPGFSHCRGARVAARALAVLPIPEQQPALPRPGPPISGPGRSCLPTVCEVWKGFLSILIALHFSARLQQQHISPQAPRPIHTLSGIGLESPGSCKRCPR